MKLFFLNLWLKVQTGRNPYGPSRHEHHMAKVGGTRSEELQRQVLHKLKPPAIQAASKPKINQTIDVTN